MLKAEVIFHENKKEAVDFDLLLRKPESAAHSRRLQPARPTGQGIRHTGDAFGSDDNSDSRDIDLADDTA